MVTLKEKNKEIKKYEAYKKKIEERYKDLAKSKKDIQKEKIVLEEFLKSVIPSSKNKQILDAEGKFFDAEVIKKVYTEHEAASRPK